LCRPEMLPVLQSASWRHKGPDAMICAFLVRGNGRNGLALICALATKTSDAPTVSPNCPLRPLRPLRSSFLECLAKGQCRAEHSAKTRYRNPASSPSGRRPIADGRRLPLGGNGSTLICALATKTSDALTVSPNCPLRPLRPLRSSLLECLAKDRRRAETSAKTCYRNPESSLSGRRPTADSRRLPLNGHP